MHETVKHVCFVGYPGWFFYPGDCGAAELFFDLDEEVLEWQKKETLF